MQPNQIQLNLNNVGKRFNKEWIFRHFTFEFLSNQSYAIVGPNGSGKSTLLQIIAGAIIINEGTITYLNQHINNLYKQISIAAPYLDLVEEFTALEMLKFHSHFKKLSLSYNEILQIVGLQKSANKQIRYYSSGMKQRLKLAQAFFCTAPILLLDEPTTNLDTDGINLYHHLIKNYTQHKTIIVSSNVKQEYEFCKTIIEIEHYKK